MIPFPAGFSALTGSIGIIDARDDVLVIAADRVVPTCGLYTKSRFAGPSVLVSRAHGASKTTRGMLVVARNANVATGPTGYENSVELTERAAALIGCSPEEVLVASTGVIGRLLPMERVRAWFGAQAWDEPTADGVAAASAIMTTDTEPKVATAQSGSASIVGIAKGVGMIEPDMATMISIVTTDAEIGSDELDALWRRVVGRTFNAVSVDSDTSTSDTAVLMASGAAGPVDMADFEQALFEVALTLTKKIARDGEGAETLIEVVVDGARDDAQAKRVAKSIVNSPLVKTAIHGADPNWGRVAMAIGKCSDDLDIEPDRTIIRFGADEVYPRLLDEHGLRELSAYMAGDEVVIHVSLGIADGAFTAYGCDLTDGYVRINADYTT
jgi:glutamate N-acetyltransferase / amino-acid N-acetyltransferase